MNNTLYLFAGAIFGLIIGWALVSMQKEERTGIFKLNQIITMSAEILEELKAEAAKIRQSLSNIRGDIARLANGLPEEGGMTAAEVAEFKTELIALSGEADTLDKENEPIES